MLNYLYVSRKAIDFFIEHLTLCGIWGAQLFSGKKVGQKMPLHPVNDRFKVEIQKNEYGFGDTNIGAESGVVVEVPDVLIYLSFHSFAFEESIVNEQKLEKIQEYYNQFSGKRIWWEALQDRGRVIKEGEKEYVYLQMTDLLAYADDINDEATTVNQTGQAGSFNLQ